MATVVTKPKEKEQEKPDVQVGDEIYFRHHKGPKSGRVIAGGKHGCLVDADGGRHKVRWEAVHGHKVRVQADYAVVDSGEDGAIVQDGGGRRRFIHDPDTTAKKGEGPIRKSFMPVVLLFGQGEEMAKAIKNGPGLSLQAVTDKGGNQTKRWKKTSKDQPKERAKGAPEAGGDEHPNGEPSAKPGDTVSFEAGEFKGAGKVKSAGKDGAVVVDSSGRPHNVHWNEIKGSERAAPAAKEPKAEGARGGGKGPLGSGGGDDGNGKKPVFRPPFPADEVAKLQHKSRQPYDSWKELSEHAPEALEQFKSALDSVVKKFGLRVDVQKPEDMTPEHLADADGYFFMGPLKTEDKAAFKVKKDYKGDYSQLRDLVRATISLNDPDQFREVYMAVEAAGLTLAQKPKDRFTNPGPDGYRDLMTVVRLPNGMVAELQYHMKPLSAVKHLTHGYYDENNELREKNHTEQPNDQWPPEDTKKFHDNAKAQRAINDPVWERITKSGLDKKPPKA